MYSPLVIQLKKQFREAQLATSARPKAHKPIVAAIEFARRREENGTRGHIESHAERLRSEKHLEKAFAEKNLDTFF